MDYMLISSGAYLMIASGLYLLFISFTMETKNIRSAIIFKVLPNALGVACLVLGFVLLIGLLG